MTADGFELRGMSPTGLLDALAELGENLEKLWENGLRIRVRSGVLGSESYVFLPAGAAHLPTERLIEKIRKYTPGFVREEVQLQQDVWQSLPSALPQLLFASAGDDPEKAQPEAGDYLLIDRRGDLTEAVALFEDLRFHASDCRVAVARHDGDDHYLFHVVAKLELRSSFDSFAAGRGLAGLERLSAFRTGEKTLFLPPQSAPPTLQALDAFRRILLDTPRIYGLGENVATAKNLLAVVFARERNEVLPLASLRFAVQAELTPAPSPGYEMELLPLAPSEEALSSLRDGIRNARPLVGYRLELRPGYPTAELKKQLERLAEELTELEQRRVYLESFLEPRPILCRYSQSQLPALADQLRSFPVTKLRSGKIRYGFQATENRPAGWHFLLYFPSEVVTAEKVPPWHWQDLDEAENTMYFWLDPLWATQYHGKGRCWVFVPQGSTLFPALHSRDPDEMDAYLKDLLLNWFPGEKPLAVPEEALYVFDEVRSGGRAEIRIQVLDLQGFRALQEGVGWLNDNLRLQHELGGVRELIAELADADSRHRLARRFERRAKESEAAFETAANAANQEMAAGATELLKVLTEEVRQITERCKTAFGEIRRMQDALARAEASLKLLTSLKEDEIDQEAKTLQETASENVDLIEGLEEKLKELAEKRESLVADVDKEIEKLGQTLRDRRQRVRSL